MRCPHCHQDSNETCAPEAFKEVIEDLDNVGNRAEESPWSVEDEIEAALYAKEDAAHQSDDDDDGDDEDWNGEYVAGPFDLSNYEALVYYFLTEDGDLAPVDVESPVRYWVSESDDHVILAEDGYVEVTIPSGWMKREAFLRFGETPIFFEE